MSAVSYAAPTIADQHVWVMVLLMSDLCYYIGEGHRLVIVLERVCETNSLCFFV